VTHESVLLLNYHDLLAVIFSQPDCSVSTSCATADNGDIDLKGILLGRCEGTMACQVGKEGEKIIQLHFVNKLLVVEEFRQKTEGRMLKYVRLIAIASLVTPA